MLNNSHLLDSPEFQTVIESPEKRLTPLIIREEWIFMLNQPTNQPTNPIKYCLFFCKKTNKKSSMRLSGMKKSSVNIQSIIFFTYCMLCVYDINSVACFHYQWIKCILSSIIIIISIQVSIKMQILDWNISIVLGTSSCVKHGRPLAPFEKNKMIIKVNDHLSGLIFVHTKVLQSSK